MGSIVAHGFLVILGRWSSHSINPYTSNPPSQSSQSISLAILVSTGRQVTLVNLGSQGVICILSSLVNQVDLVSLVSGVILVSLVRLIILGFPPSLVMLVIVVGMAK